jgi:tetratricopeptide (TPR) repeat protein
MSDPQRSDRFPLTGDVHERDARIEEFLLSGLDHYFSEQYELAINVWTRVLFIDRGHARARAYIERARGAIAERQRKGDELLHTGAVALDRGDAGRARQLVTSAVEHGASADEALALIARIDRLENASQGLTPSNRSASIQEQSGGVVPALGLAARWRWVGGGAIGGIVIGAAALIAFGRGTGTFPLFGPPESVPVSTLNAPLPVPTIGEVQLSRAQTLYARGRFQEALAALDGVPAGDPHRGRADELTATIQRQLLAAARSTGRSASSTPSRVP